MTLHVCSARQLPAVTGARDVAGLLLCQRTLRDRLAFLDGLSGWRRQQAAQHSHECCSPSCSLAWSWATRARVLEMCWQTRARAAPFRTSAPTRARRMPIGTSVPARFTEPWTIVPLTPNASTVTRIQCHHRSLCRLFICSRLPCCHQCGMTTRAARCTLSVACA